MIYKNLDEIPYKTFIKIIETSNVQLLSNTEFDKDKLNEIWDKIIEEHESKNEEDKAVFDVNKEIEIFLCKHKLVLMCCSILSFDYQEDAFNKVIEIGYQLRTDSTQNYYEDIAQIEREANGYLHMVNRLKEQLPKEEKNIEKSSIDDVMSSYSSFLGYSIGKHNEITYNEFYATQKQVYSKMKQLQKK